MDNAIALKGVTKTFGRTKAVQNLDLTVPNGGLWGFIGPNGAGKTTSIRMMMSILFPDSGEISILGHASALDAKDRIGYLPEERGVYRRMRVGAFLVYMAREEVVQRQTEPRHCRTCRMLSRTCRWYEGNHPDCQAGVPRHGVESWLGQMGVRWARAA